MRIYCLIFTCKRRSIINKVYLGLTEQLARTVVSLKVAEGHQLWVGAVILTVNMVSASEPENIFWVYPLAPKTDDIGGANTHLDRKHEGDF